MLKRLIVNKTTRVKQALLGFKDLAVSSFLRTEGVAALEFALLTPVFLVFLMAILEYSLMGLSQTQLSSALVTLSRLGKTGQIPGITSQAAAASIIANNMTLPFYAAGQITVCTQINVTSVSGLVPCTAASPFNPGTGGTR
jgi:Flp pilus assembly protein TadG